MSKEERQFQGAWAPVFLFEMVEGGKLTPTEAWLWLNINSFQKNGRRCYMSNETLGGRIGMKERKVRYSLARMEGLGILARTVVGDERFITCLYQQGGTTVPGGRHDGAGEGGTDVPHKDTNRNNTLSAPANAGVRTPIVKKAYVQLAQELAGAIEGVKNIKCQSKVRGWAVAIQKLETVQKIPKPHIKEVLRHYTKNINRHAELYFPQVWSGQSAYEKFEKMEGLMARDGRTSLANSNGNGHPAPMKIIAVHRRVDRINFDN